MRLPNGALGVSDEGGDGLVGKGRSLLFLFPFGTPTRIVRLQLSEFNDGTDRGLFKVCPENLPDPPNPLAFQFTNDRWEADGVESSSSSSNVLSYREMEIVEGDTDTAEATHEGYTFYRLEAMDDAEFGVSAVTVESVVDAALPDPLM